MAKDKAWLRQDSEQPKNNQQPKEQVKEAAQEPRQKIGEGHAKAWLRQGTKELAQFLPAFNNGQHIVEEPGLIGNPTQGEVANSRDGQLYGQDANQEPTKRRQRERGGMEM